MFMGKYIIADVAVEIVSIYEEIHNMCAAYSCADETPVQLSVHIAQKDIVAEQEKSNEEAAREGLPVVAHAEAYLETLAVYRKMAKQMMMEHDVLLFHGSAIAVEGQAVLFTAKSGTGKSTHTRFWREEFGSRVRMVNDDKPFLHIGQDAVTVYGTPWRGKHSLGENISAPLEAIYFVNRGVDNRVEPMTPRELYPLLLQQTYTPENPEAMVRSLALVDRLSRNVKLLKLYCNLDPQAAHVALDALE